MEDDSDPIDFRTCLTSIQKLKILDDDTFTKSGLKFQDHVNSYIKYWQESDVINSFNGISKYKVRNKIKEMLICLSDTCSEMVNENESNENLIKRLIICSKVPSDIFTIKYKIENIMNDYICISEIVIVKPIENSKFEM